MLDRNTLDTKIAEIEQALQGQEMIIKLLREALAELKEQSVCYYLYEELRQLKKALGQHHMEYPDEFNILKSTIEQTDWPLALDNDAIISDEEPRKEQRAENIVEFVITDYLKDLKFLDFGCGEGHVSNAALKQSPKQSIGYDIKEQGWDRWEGL